MGDDKDPITSAKLIAVAGFIIVSTIGWVFSVITERIQWNTSGRSEAKILSATHDEKINGLSRRVLVLEDGIIHDHRMLKYPDTETVSETETK
jgi:hypothetical protein